jgi:hypothetical protein
LLLDEPPGAEKEIPYTKFSGQGYVGFRCVAN